MAKARCTGTSKQTGNRCGQYPAPGAAVCKWHGGGAPQVRAAAIRRLQAEEARADLVRLGVAIETTPLEALELLLWEAAGNVAVLRSMVAELGGAIHASSGWRAPGGELTALPHVLVLMYDAERDRLARIAKDLAALGFDERRLSLAEVTATRLYDALERAMDRAGLTVEVAASVKLSLANELRAA